MFFSLFFHPRESARERSKAKQNSPLPPSLSLSPSLKNTGHRRPGRRQARDGDGVLRGRRAAAARRPRPRPEARRARGSLRVPGRAGRSGVPPRQPDRARGHQAGECAVRVRRQREALGLWVREGDAEGRRCAAAAVTRRGFFFSCLFFRRLRRRRQQPAPRRRPIARRRLRPLRRHAGVPGARGGAGGPGRGRWRRDRSGGGGGGQPAAGSAAAAARPKRRRRRDRLFFQLQQQPPQGPLPRQARRRLVPGSLPLHPGLRPNPVLGRERAGAVPRREGRAAAVPARRSRFSVAQGPPLQDDVQGRGAEVDAAGCGGAPLDERGQRGGQALAGRVRPEVAPGPRLPPRFPRSRDAAPRRPARARARHAGLADRRVRRRRRDAPRGRARHARALRASRDGRGVAAPRAGAAAGAPTGQGDPAAEDCGGRRLVAVRRRRRRGAAVR